MRIRPRRLLLLTMWLGVSPLLPSSARAQANPPQPLASTASATTAALTLPAPTPTSTSATTAASTASPTPAPAPTHNVKVAVIDLTHSPDTETLLTAALAKQDGLEVLERAQLSQLVAEKQLNDLAGSGKFSALGQLLGADGVVVLDRIELPGSVATGAPIPAVSPRPTQVPDRVAVPQRRGGGNLTTSVSNSTASSRRGRGTDPNQASPPLPPPGTTSLDGRGIPSPGQGRGTPPVLASSAKLTARLIAVGTGACVFIKELPDDSLSVNESVAWIADLVAARKSALSAPTGNVIPIALLNLRSDYSAANLAAQRATETLRTALKELLGLGLSNTPDFLLLERNRLGDVAFEKSLDATDASPLLASVVLIDGSLSTWQADGNFTVRLWLRHSDGTQAGPVIVAGQNSDLPDAILRMIGEIRRLSGLTALAQAPAINKDEARRFTRDAFWALRFGRNVEAADEAITAARALGDNSPDAFLIESVLTYLDYYTRFAPGRSSPSFPDSYITADPSTRGLLQQADPEAYGLMLKQALSGYASFLEEGGKVINIIDLVKQPTASPLGGTSSRLKADDPTSFPMGRIFPVELSADAAAFLEACDENRELGWEELRQLARLPTAANSPQPVDPTLLVRFGPTLAQNADELMSWYERVLFDAPAGNKQALIGTAPELNDPPDETPSRAPMIFFLPATPEMALGIRFQNDPQARLLWTKLMDRALAAEPSVRARALFALAGTGETPQQVEYYLEFLHTLQDHAVELEQAGQLDDLLRADSLESVQPYGYPKGATPPRAAVFGRTPPPPGVSARDKNLRQPLARERAELILAILNSLGHFHENLLSQVAFLSIPDDLLPVFAQAYQAYRTRCLAEPAEADLAALQLAFRQCEDRLRQHNPHLVLPLWASPTPAPISGPPLVVHQVWLFPELSAGSIAANVQAKVLGDNIWVRGVPAAGAQDSITHNYEISLNDFAAKPMDVPGRIGSLAATSAAVWFDKFGGDTPYALVRHDLQTGVNTEWPLDRQMSVYCVGERVFLQYNSRSFTNPAAGLFEVNPSDGRRTLRISLGREPPESPFDSRLDGLLTFGLGQTGQVLIKIGSSRIYDIDQNWKEQFADYDEAILHGNETLLLDHQKGIFLIRSGSTDLEPLVTPRADNSVRMAHNWTWGAAWNFPHDDLPLVMEQQGNFFRVESVTVLRADQIVTNSTENSLLKANARYFLRWWHEGGPAEGVRIPVQQSNPSSATLLQGIEIRGSDLFRLERIANPAATGYKNDAPPTPSEPLYRCIIHWWFNGGPPEGLSMPLQFDLNPAVSANLPDSLKSPVPKLMSPSILQVAPSGLVLSNVPGGFWFIPNADLDAYRQAHWPGPESGPQAATNPAPASAATSPPSLAPP